MKAGKRRIHRLVVMPDETTKQVFITMEKYDHIPWGGQEGGTLIEGNKRLIEGRPPDTVLMEEQIVERPLMLKVSTKHIFNHEFMCCSGLEASYWQQIDDGCSVG